MEYEISTNSFEDTNLLLNALGLIRRNYQEKIRHSFIYKDAKIEIDKWPIINPYLEIECDDENVIREVIKLLELDKYDIVSLNTTDVYKRSGIDILSMPELRFEDDKINKRKR